MSTGDAIGFTCSVATLLLFVLVLLAIPSGLTIWEVARRLLLVVGRTIIPRRSRNAPVEDEPKTDRVADLERATGLYQPLGDYLSKCPACGGVAILSHDPAGRISEPLCALCAIGCLEAHGKEYLTGPNAWDCCALRDGSWSDGCCNSGCRHMSHRQEANRLFQADRRSAKAAPASAQEEGTRGDR